MESIDFCLESYDYLLDSNQIAQTPLNPRHSSRLMILREEQKDQTMNYDNTVWDIRNELNPGDLLILNDTKVLKARLSVRFPSGKRGEIFILEKYGDNYWKCLAKPSRKMKIGDELMIEKESEVDIPLKIISNDASSGGKIVEISNTKFNVSEMEKFLEIYGQVPLPPYIKRRSTSDFENYQTCFAKSPGAVAAPTAGLHFTDELLCVLKEKGVKIAKITLHVGLGTFKPMEVADLNDLELHSEYVEVKEDVINLVRECKNRGRSVYAIGTTAVRAIEGAYKIGKNNLVPVKTKIDLVIKPGYQFGVIDGLLTNFHLPKSSLLLLVSALIGRKRMLKIYSLAIEKKYRFFSYGDAMLIKPEAVIETSKSNI